MKRMKWSILLGLGLLSSSLVMYFIHYTIFGELRSILFIGVASLAFVPIQGLVVTLIIAELMVIMNRGARLQKMNMVIGVFFSELGTGLLRSLYLSDSRASRLRETMEMAEDLSVAEVASLMGKLHDYPFRVEMDRSDLEGLRGQLISSRDFMVRLLENPSLLENEKFTNMLWAVFHLTEELDARETLLNIPDSDLEHLLGDVSRSYQRLFGEWLCYMRHLHDNYPYLYSFAMRTSPLEPEMQVEVA
jgi:hypothetical protein